MGKILNIETKRKLALLLALLIAFSSGPAISMGSSYAAVSEYNESGTSDGELVSGGDSVTDGDSSDSEPAAKKYTVSWCAVNGGSVSAEDVGGTNGTLEVECNADVNLEFVPDAGYQVAAISVDGASVLPVACTVGENGNYEYVLRDVTAHKQVMVWFDQITKVAGNVTTDDLGIVMVNQKGQILSPDEDNTYYGQSVTVSGSDGYAYRLAEQGAYASTIELNATTRISWIYQKECGVQTFGTEQKYELKEPVTVVIDTTLPTIESVEEETDIWLEGTINKIDLNGRAEDTHLNYVVWSETELDEAGILNCMNRTYEFENGSFTFADVEMSVEKDSQVFYLYAVDKAENCSEAMTVNVYRDRTAAVITNVAITSEEEANILPYGTFSDSPLKLTVTAKDVAEAGYTSGLQTVVIYAGDNQTPIVTESVSAPVRSGDEITFEVTVPCGEEQGFSTLSEMRIRVIDAMGNVSADYRLANFIDGISNLVMIENCEPLVELEVSAKPGTAYQKTDGESTQCWYSDIPDISYTVSDMQGSKKGSGLFERTLTLNGREIVDYTKNDYSAVDSYSAVLQREAGTIDAEKLSDMAEGENELLISVQDIAGNLGQDSVKIYLDRQAPVITGFSFRIQEESTQGQSGQQYAFGNFYNSVVEVTVYVADDLDAAGAAVPSAGLKSVTLYLDGKACETTEEIVDGKAVFLLPEEKVLDEEKLYLDTVITASAEDMVGNSSEAVDMTEVEDGPESSTVMIETVNPGLTISVDGEYYEYDEKTLYAKEDISFTIQAGDEHSGLQSIKVYVNGKLLQNKEYSGDATERSVTDTLTVNTSDAVINAQNLYDMEVVVTDNSGNQSSDSMKVYLDTTAPQILEFEMQADGRTQLSGQGIAAADMPYGYYFRENVTVNIFATDGTKEADCGVKEIQYYLVSGDGVSQEVQSVEVNEDGYATITIPAGFKGQLYACAYDRLMNAEEVFVSPEGLIVEPYSLHAQETHIAFHKSSASKRDATGLELYSESVPVVVTVTDIISGIQDVEWSVTAPYDTGKNESGSIQIDNTGNFVAGAGDWKKTGEDKNLVTELTKTFVVSHNSNDITLYIKMTDRAGNVTYSECNFSIDTANPVIEVVFDNGDSDSVYTNVYNSERTATITVQERNFSSTEIIAEITNTDGFMPVFSEWSTSEDETNPDATINTVRITFSDDGDYTMTVGGKDAAGNNANGVTVDEFVIDRTTPEIAVAYNNNDVRNNSYYSQGRIATIRITEHNFAPERVSIVGTAINGDEEMAFPAISDWSSDGDVYTATIACEKDGLYQFEVEYADKAGNAGEKFTSDSYYVDLIAPVIEISGVEPFSANNGDVIPVISMSDSNYAYGSASIELTGANSGKVELEGKYALQTGGQTYTFSNFPKEQAYDDVYTLTVTLKDLAGNETTETITFSVNRFGSVYIFDDSLKEIAGSYIREEIDVKLTEINIDSLEHDTIKVMVDANGNIRDLVEGEDYTVSRTGGNGNWYRYEYVIDRAIFAGDGRYIVTLYSRDQAGNINQNIDEDKKAEISFGVDKTAPIIIPIDIESDTQYLVDRKTATVAVNDNLVLDNVEIYVGDEQCEYEVSGENYTFSIPEADEKQSVTVVARDLAGNTTNIVVSDVLVTTNLLVSWFNNTPLFVGTIAGAAAIAGGAISIIVMFKRRKKK